MGASCSCSKCVGFPQDLDLEKERKINMDFFLDNNGDIATEDINQNKIKNKATEITSNNNDLPIYSTKSYSNINNENKIININSNKINIPIFGNESYNKMMNQIMGEEDKNNDKDKEIFIRENNSNSKGIFINAENDNKEVFINAEDDNKEIFMNAEDDNREIFMNAEDDNREGFINAEDNENKQIFRKYESNNEVIINAEDNSKEEVFINAEDNNNERSVEEDQSNKGNFINMEDNNKENFIRVCDNENELIIKDENDDENKISINKNSKYEDINEMEGSNTELKIKPKKVALSHNINLNTNTPKNSIGSLISRGSINSNNINKKELIYSTSSQIISRKKYGNEIISDEEYKAQPNDEYSRIIFDFINKLRRNPKYIANMIDENKKYIFMGDSNKLFFRKNNIKFGLNKGLPIFEETINELNNLEPMNKMVFNKNITVDLPDNEDDINNLDYIKNKVEILQNNGRHISSYWKEKIKDPEIAFLMMTVDDNYIQKGLKRKDLINPEYIYIGISSIEINDKFACYITLSNRK